MSGKTVDEALGEELREIVELRAEVERLKELGFGFAVKKNHLVSELTALRAELAEAKAEAERLHTALKSVVSPPCRVGEHGLDAQDWAISAARKVLGSLAAAQPTEGAG